MNMNRKEIVERVRIEAKELEALVKKLQYRSEHLNWLADALESDGKPPPAPTDKLGAGSKFRKLIDKVYGEKPKRP
jgi:hypothetical protein